MFLFRSAVRSLSHCNLPIEPINVAFDNNLLNVQRRGFAAVAIAAVVGNKCSSQQPFKVQINLQQIQQARSFSSMQYRNLTASMSSFPVRRNLCTHEITKSLTLYSNTPRNVDKDPKTLRLKEPIEAPLVLIFGWLMARKKHLAKYVKLYTDQGYDALAVDVTPWQMLWPVKGSQLVAGTVVKFLENNPSFDPMVIHGFSVGGYVFGEVLVHMARDMKRYQPILDRFVAQVWDSAADITEIPAGFPKAVFPKNDKLQKVLRNYIQLKQPIEAPLVVIFSWMLARRSHLAKYAQLYTDLGFDAITVEITPWQLLWPLKGSQLIAADFIKFLENNQSYNPCVIHGFSVGGYMCGEVMLQMSRDMKKYQPILDKFVAQIWDSAADITEIPVGFPKAMFPNNPTLENTLRRYVRYHMRTFHEQATTHYIRSSQMFHSTLVKCPALMFVSKSDPIGAESSNWSVKEDWESGGVKVTWKCWDRSPHVLHYQKHPEEYREYLFAHLQEYALDKIPQKSRAKL